jgi:hypothetical protein
MPDELDNQNLPKDEGENGNKTEEPVPDQGDRKGGGVGDMSEYGQPTQEEIPDSSTPSLVEGELPGDAEKASSSI